MIIITQGLVHAARSAPPHDPRQSDEGAAGRGVRAGGILRRGSVLVAAERLRPGDGSEDVLLL